MNERAAARRDTGRPMAGRGAEKALATRAALVELAAELFAERGYVQTSIRDIARRGAVTSGAIYGHFRNKADLLAAAIGKQTTDELEAHAVEPAGQDHVETLARLAADYPSRRRLRALIVQGAAAAQTDAETRDSLRAEQLAHLDAWVEGYERHRERLGIDAALDLRTAVLHSWAAELGLGVLEAFGIDPTSPQAWADISRRFGRSLRLPPDEPPAPARRRRRPTTS